MYCWTEPANGCRICIGSASGSCELLRFVLRRGSSFDWCSLGVLPLTSTSYTQEKVSGQGRDSASGERSRRVWHARFRHRFSIPSGAAGTNLRKTARYAGENCDPLQFPSLVFWGVTSTVPITSVSFQ